MHLTPRTLGMAMVATVTGCTVLGIMASLDLASAAHSDAQTVTTSPATEAAAAASTPPAAAAAAEGTGALTSSAPTGAVRATEPGTATPTAAPTASSTASLPQPSPTTTSETPSSTPTHRATPPRPAPTPEREPARPVPTATPSVPRPSAPAVRRTATRNSWRAPALQVGSTTITRPRLTSGAPVSVTVACSPGSGCTMTGAQLNVASGTSVTVTWSAPSRPGYTTWRATRVL